MKLQDCPKCAARFDVSAFAPGQQFRCGSCGQLMTAHQASPSVAAAATRTPPAPGRTAAPASTAGSSVAAARSPRGPQFQPAQRAQEAPRSAPPPPPPPPSRSSRSDRGGHRGRGADAKKGPPMALIAGGGALVVAVLVIVLMSGSGGDKPKGGGSADGTSMATGPVAPPPPVQPSDTVADVKRDLAKVGADERTSKQWKEFIRRLKSLGEPARETLLAVYGEYVETAHGTDDAEARKALGYMEFNHALPEEISQTKGRAFLAAFEAARQQRWLKEEEEVRLAGEALKQTTEHARKLREDRVYRAGDSIWNYVLQDPLFKDQNFAVRWSAPHLICYCSKDRLSELDLLALPKPERRKLREELAAKRATYEPLLNEKQAIYAALYAEWNRRFKEDLGLGDLTAEYGGRPDLVAKKKASYHDGVPLVVWIFDSHESFKHFHKAKGMELPDGVGGYFEWKTAWIYLFDEKNEGEARIFEISKNLHEGAHQLEHWFGMQMCEWRENKKFTQSWIGEGLAEYFGAHKVKEDGEIEFTGKNFTRLQEARRFAAEFKKEGKKYPIAKLDRMVSWTRYSDAAEYAAELGYNPQYGQLLFIYEQGSMLFEMCMDGMPEKYRDKLMNYLRSCMLREEGLEHFKRSFKIRDEDDWEVIQKDFEAYVEKMLTMDIGNLGYKPKARPAPKKS